MELIYDIGDIHQAAKKVADYTKNTKLFAFHGNMGAGKTTFIHALCEELKVQGTVGSPTFSIINEYRSPTGKIFHIDLYRLKDEEEAFRAGVEDCLYSGETCFVEWPEKAPGIFPEETLHLYLTVINPDTRKLSLSNAI